MTYTVDNDGNVNPSSRTVTTPAAQRRHREADASTRTCSTSAQHYLDQAVPSRAPTDAEVAVLDVQTGQVLALASSGTFDPRTRTPSTRTCRSTRRSCRRSSPARCRRSITFAAALQQGLITPQTVVACPDAIRRAASPSATPGAHPTEQFTATGVLAESSNVGTLKIAQKIGPTTWYHYEKMFGVGAEDRHRAARRERRLPAADGARGRPRRSRTCRSGRARA